MYNHVYTYAGAHTGIVLYAVDCTQHMIVLCCIIRLVYSLWSEVYLLPETQLCRRGGSNTPQGMSCLGGRKLNDMLCSLVRNFAKNYIHSYIVQ